MRQLQLITFVSITIFSCSDNRTRSGELTTKSAEAYMKGNYELALKQADSAVMFNDENSNAYLNRGAAKRKLKYPFKDFESDILRSLELEPDNYSAISSIMNIYFDNKEYNKVLHYAEQYQKLYSTDSVGLNNIIGESYRAVKDYEKSFYFLNKAIQQEPDSWAVNLNLGELYMDKSDHNEALKYLDKAKRMNPNYSSTFNELGISHYVLGRVDSALYYVNAALKLEQDTVFMINKGVYLMKLDSIEAGCNWFAKVEKMGRTIEKIYGKDSEAFELKLKYCKE